MALNLQQSCHLTIMFLDNNRGFHINKHIENRRTLHNIEEQYLKLNATENGHMEPFFKTM